MLDFVILTEDRYENPKVLDWYIKNILKEDGILLESLTKLGFSAKRVSWSSRSFDWSSTRHVIFRSTWDYFERFAEFENWLKITSLKTKFINTYSQIIWNLDKSYLQYFDKEGINIVPSFFMSEGFSLKGVMKKNNWTEVITKPTISAAAWNTHRVSEKNLKKHEPIFCGLQKKQKMIIQEFQKSILSFGEISLILIGGKFTHAVIKRAKRGDYRVQDDYGGSVKTYQPSMEEVQFGELVASKCKPIPAYARVDIIIDNKNELALSELELIEPELWFRFCPDSAHLLAKEITKNY